MNRHSLRAAFAALWASALAAVTPPAGAASLADSSWNSRGLPVCAAAHAQDAPWIATDGSGGVFLVWQDARVHPDTTDLYVQHLLGDGSVAPGWPVNGAPLCTAPGNQLGPHLVADGSGGVLVAWEDERLPGQPRVYAQHLTSALAPAPGWAAQGNALCTAAGSQRGPRMVSDGSGGIVVAWEDYRYPQPRIYTTRVLASGAFAIGWPDSGRPAAPVVGGQVSPVIAPDGSGGAVVAWIDGRGGAATSADVYAQRLLAGGATAPGWPTSGIAVCDAVFPQERVTVAADGAGGAFFAWMDARDAVYYIYAQHLDPSGALAPGWLADGAAVGAVGAAQFDPVLAPDGTGALLVAWTDSRNGGGNSDIYAQRLAADGTPSWAADGEPVCIAPGDQLSPRLQHDGAGGALVAWQDLRLVADPRPYAHHVLVTGVLDTNWPAAGRALADTNQVQGTMAWLGDGSGGAFAAWSGVNLSQPGASVDLYAARIASNGVVAARASALSAQARWDGVELRWWMPEASAVVAIERREGDAPWREVAAGRSDGTGVVAWEDRAVTPGATYGWRLRTPEGAAGEVWATVPLRALAIAALGPLPAADRVVATLSLPRRAPARLALLDVAGRRVWERSIDGAGNSARVSLEAGMLAPGVYLLRLTQDGESASARLVVAR